jgi:hypothetical protein
MTQTVTLPGDVYRKLAQGAAERGMTVESLLTVVSNLMVLPTEPTPDDRNRAKRIEALLARYQAGKLTPDDRILLDQLIDADYQTANARADRLIDAKQARTGNARIANGSSHRRKRSQK